MSFPGRPVNSQYTSWKVKPCQGGKLIVITIQRSLIVVQYSGLGINGIKFKNQWVRFVNRELHIRNFLVYWNVVSVGIESKVSLIISGRSLSPH